MNDLFYIEYEAKRMLVDTMDMSPRVELAHRRLCDFIWAMDKAPKSDDTVLQGIARCTDTNWPTVKAGLIEKGWVEKDGLFFHLGAVNSLNNAKQKYASRLRQTESANRSKGSKPAVIKLVTMDVTGIVTIVVTKDVTRDVTTPPTKDVTSGNQNQNQCTYTRTTETEAVIPTLAEVQTYGELHGVPQDTAKRFFDHHNDNNLWLNQHGRLIRWQTKLTNWATNDRTTQNTHATHPRNRNASPDRNAGTLNEGRAGDYAGV